MPGGFDLGSAATSASPAGMAANLAGGVIQGISGIITGIAQRRAAKKLQRQVDQERGQALGYANDVLDQGKQGLSEARNIYNGRMAGAAQAEQNYAGAQAGTLASLQRNATDASQLLSLAGAAQGATNDAYAGLAVQEAQDKQRRYSNVVGAQNSLQGAYGNLQDIYSNQAFQDQGAANQLGGASQQNMANGIGSMASMGMVAGMGGYNGLFGGGQHFPPNPTIDQRAMQGPFQYTPPPAVNFSLPPTSNILSTIKR
jgi:hypothetical protein